MKRVVSAVESGKCVLAIAGSLSITGEASVVANGGTTHPKGSLVEKA